MKKRNREISILFIFTLLSLAVFVLSEIASVSIILYSTKKDMIDLFRFGAMLNYLWVTNPIPLILSIFGAIRSHKYRKYYFAIICFSAAIWLIGGIMIAMCF